MHGPQASTFTICWTLRIMPRTSGVSSSSTVRCLLLSPRPIRVARWSLVRRIGDPVCVTLIFAIVLLRHRPVLGRGVTLRQIKPALEDRTSGVSGTNVYAQVESGDA